MFNFFTVVDEKDAKLISTVTLAFVGDAVYSLVLTSDYSTGKLQKISCEEVSAHGQNILLEKILPRFTEEELAVFKRGRNAKKPTHSKSASIAEYNNSTGLEAVLGYIYLVGRYDRLTELLN